MGKLIAFWSPWHGQTKTTASMAAVAMAMNNISNDSVALFHTQSGMADLEGMFDNRMDSEKRIKLYEGSGINSLLLEFKQTEIGRDNVVKASLPTAIDGVVFLPGLEMDTQMAKMDDVREILYTLAVRDIPKAFDWTFVDLASGNNPLSMKIMEAADVVVVTISQNVAIWERFFDEYENIADNPNVFYVIGGHRQESSYGIRNFRRIQHVDKKKSGIVPDSIGYMDAISNGRVAEFFLMNEKATKKDENGIFLQECKDTALKIRNLAYGYTVKEADE